MKIISDKVACIAPAVGPGIDPFASFFIGNKITFIAVAIVIGKYSLAFLLAFKHIVCVLPARGFAIVPLEYTIAGNVPFTIHCAGPGDGIIGTRGGIPDRPIVFGLI